MNGENNHIFHTSALDNAPDDAGRQPYVWPLFALQLWVLAAFVGLSLIAIAARRLFEDAGGDGLGLLMLASWGVALVLAAWGKAEHLLDRAERELRRSDRSGHAGDHAPRIRVNTSPAPALETITGITPTL
jgi:hypothetical protein